MDVLMGGISVSLLFAIVTRCINREEGFLPDGQGARVTHRSFVQRNISCRKNGEMMELNEHLTDVEIMRAVRNLDPDLCSERTRKKASTFIGICITLLTGLISAITYICLYIRSL